ncbi:amidohydrolase [Atopomonas sediminilitoris]|uniref:amidohydrolase n=1 Tax=Atopomonas sediminilitoris TaxID=2919919 RepID=UPI001F4DAE13|nr:amidohydrolase [Atopomonas sediminilitoris]MCJ8167880.1 amidohydrolase [Atopomonas sediminilitoris]
MTRLFTGSLVLCAALLSSACSPPSDTPQQIFFGGPILTLDPAQPQVEALAIRDGVISALGTAAEIRALAGADTQQTDLKGRTLLPGFIAAHEHPTLTAVFGGVIDLSGFRHRSSAAVWQALREGVQAGERGEWLYGMGIDPILVPELRMPTRALLDEIAPDQPLVLISQTLHSFWANSAAFAAAGIDQHTEDPGHGSYYEKDSNGELTGFIAESAAAKPLLAELQSPLRMLGRYEAALDELLAAGFTSVASQGYNVPSWMARYAALRNGKPRIRQYFYLTESELDALPDSAENGDAFFRVQGVKLWHDGSPYTGSMYLQQNYLNNALTLTLGMPSNSRGKAMLAPQAFAQQLQQLTEQGWQVSIHSQGDASNSEVAQAIAQLKQPTSRPLRLEHSLLLPPSLMPQLAAAGVSPSFHINHILYYGDALDQAIIGPERAQQVLPVRRAFELGMHPTLHADSPMFAANAFSLMQTAITRRTQSGLVLGADQAISPEQALQAMTINGAYQLGIAEQTGSLAVGKWADFQILSGNPLTSAASTLTDLRHEAVFVQGRQVYPAQ